MDEGMTFFRREYTDAWLLMAWPGAGQVAMASCSYLVEKLGMRPLARIRSDTSGEVPGVTIRDGLVEPKPGNSNQVYGWKNPTGGRNLLVFFGAAPPSSNKTDYCRQLVRLADLAGVQRIFTLDALVTGPVVPSEAAVRAIATDQSLLDELAAAEPPVEALDSGELSGMNAALFSAAKADGADTVGLIGEVPVFAVNLPYLRACRGVLETLKRLGGFDWDLSDLQAMSERLDRKLSTALEKLDELPFGLTLRKSAEEEEEAPEWELRFDTEEEDGLEPEEVERIERLFEVVENDRSRAIELKAMLDAHGVFKAYEDRFLDLFSESA